MDPLVLIRKSDTDIQVSDKNEIMIKKLLALYLADPTSDTTPDGLNKWAEEHKITKEQVHAWKRCRSVQLEVVSHIKDSFYNGANASEVYRKAMDMLMDTNVRDTVKASIINNILRLDMKRVELAAKLSIATKKRKGKAMDEIIKSGEVIDAQFEESAE